jgi:hypothetical protein
MNKFIPAIEYTWLCEDCRNELVQLTNHFEQTWDTLTDLAMSNEEFPCDFMYDNRLFCGQYTCINGDKENE